MFNNITHILMNLYRRMSPKCFAIMAMGLTIILCIYYISYTSDVSTHNRVRNDNRRHDGSLPAQTRKSLSYSLQKPCSESSSAEADINTVEVFKKFEFQPAWMKSKEYWNKTFEDRYENQKVDPGRPPLKVIIVPHSHNDPGWLNTFEHYFHYQSRQIINHMVAKLQEYKNLTFIWSEVAFLNAWWEEAHPSKQQALKSLVKSGRLEITTGGWVMTDEANTHIYAMLDQLIEGHQWLWTNLEIKPKSGWSIDPFGHGSTVPYLLAKTGFKGTVIQRIHYAWKQWLALKQFGDFRWIPGWSSASSSDAILVHNQPFDIYSIKHSCGPHPYICLNFDFRKAAGEYTEASIKAQSITAKNVKDKSELLLEQYARTGSLFPHNVVLMPLGDDFRYNIAEEYDQQYLNYMKLIQYINENKAKYNAEITFGTPVDYFEEIMKRFKNFPSLKGDFFVYSDIFTEGRPAYWSGYFTTRPLMKILSRELENNLRATEIVYTIALNYAKQKNLTPHLKILERDFERLVNSRRSLGLFQHHDAITGTSKSFVMRDYGMKLFEALRNTVSVQQNAIQSLLFPNSYFKQDHNILLSDLERESYEKLSQKTPIVISPNRSRKIVLYNSLAHVEEQVIHIRTTTANVKVIDSNNNDIIYQINPVWKISESNTNIWISSDEFEIVFIAKMPQLSLVTYTLIYEENIKDKVATIYCNKCNRNKVSSLNGNANVSTNSNIPPKFKVQSVPSGDIQLENHKLKLLFDGNSGFMKTVTRKDSPKVMQCRIQFAAYKSAQFHSGAYLFMPDPNENEIERDVLQQYKEFMNIIITSGPVSSEITSVYGPFLVHTVSIYHTSTALAAGIYIENTIDFEMPPKNRETELFMRILSDIQNGEPPEFYSDQNGFQMQKRVKIEKINIEGNYYPITTMAYIEDEHNRLSLLTNHAQGAASWQPGYLEVMLDRRTLYDDARGMGEGLVDNKKTINKFWLLIEDINSLENKNEKVNAINTHFDNDDVLRSFNIPNKSSESRKPETYSRPSLYANKMVNSLNYPVSIFIIDGEHDNFEENMKLLNKPFSCDLHLMMLRTQPDTVYFQFPSSSALLVIQRQGYDCSINSGFTCDVMMMNDDISLFPVAIKQIESKLITGVESSGENIHKLSDIIIEPMAIKTFNITFV